MFRFTLCLVCLVIIGATGKLRRLDGRIVGGEDAEIEDFPYQVALQTRGEHLCGGSLISPKYVITAAHCTYGASVQSITVRAGTSHRESGGVLVNVTKIYQHPSFSFISIDYDLSVLELETELELSKNINTVGLPVSGSEAKTGTEVVCTGWGATTEGGSAPEQLQKVILNIVDRKICEDSYDRNITKRMLCAGVDGGDKDACQGDSGGPLVQDGVLYGVVSWGRGCARPNYPGVYADVSNLRKFINQVSGL